MENAFATNSQEFKGKLIAVEGLDGSGKSTQIYLLKRWFELTNLKVFFTEWNSSLLVKTATKKGKRSHLLTPTTFSLIHCTDFADRYERQILPLLQAGYLVLCDRYIYTAYARDAVRGCDRQWLRDLYQFAVKPDITLFFNVPLETALNRILSSRPQLKYHEAGMDMNLSNDPYESFRIFQERINNEYHTMIDECDFNVVNGEREIAELQDELREVVAAKIDLSLYRRRAR